MSDTDLALIAITPEGMKELAGAMDALLVAIPPEETETRQLVAEVQQGVTVLLDAVQRLKDGVLMLRDQRNELYEELAVLGEIYTQGADFVLKLYQKAVNDILVELGWNIHSNDGLLSTLVKDINAQANRRVLEQLKQAKEGEGDPS